MKIYFSSADPRFDGTAEAALLFASAVSLACSAGCALFHRYTAAEALAYHLTALRRRVRGRSRRQAILNDGPDKSSDWGLAAKQDAIRDRYFSRSDSLLKTSMVFLVLGILAFCGVLGRVMFAR